MVKVSEAEKNAIIAKLQELVSRKAEMTKVKVKSGISYISMNKNLKSTTKTQRKTQKALQKV